MIHFFRKIRHIIYVLVALFSLLFILSRGPSYDPKEFEYGITFSYRQSTDLGLDWKQVYLAMLDELQVKNLRLPAYWDDLEATKGQYDWEALDWQIDEAEKRNVSLILVLGQRVPRWPECHIPNWAEDLAEKERQEVTLEHIQKTISRYKNRPNIRFWQVENEPFLPNFGICPEFDKKFLDTEIALAKELDTRPVIVTDSGELSLWALAAKRADVFGTTMYLDTYSKTLKSYIHYPITPAFFRVKKNLANLFASPQDWIVIELQGEPWGRLSFQTLEQSERDKTMTPDRFKNTIAFIQDTGFKTFYWWGIEYWYWEKQVNNNPFYWNTAQQLFNGTYDYK